MYHVILSGGSGTRFWPMSTQNKPKQLINIIKEKTMIRLTVNRLKKITSTKYILIVASNSLCKSIQKELPEIPKDNYIIEPSPKNTAPAIALAAINVMYRDINSVMVIYPSDHMISGDTQFKNSILKGIDLAKKESVLITLGVKPTYPSTAYGYIKYDSSDIPNFTEILKVNNFVEKPNKINAKKYFSSKQYFWNCGIFIWKASEILASMKKFMANDYNHIINIYNSLSKQKYKSILDKKWHQIKKESIDYGILQKAKNVYTIEAHFKWNDLGSWKSFFDFVEKNENGSYYSGDVLALESSNNLVISPNRLTAIVGIDNITIINLDKMTLVMPTSEAESVKELVKMIKSLNKKEYL
tara:strand:- start:1046 stop:2113 length:1068 start_codon:yes stop_codon:yes gene_type:complete